MSLRSDQPEHVVLVSDRGPVQFTERSGWLRPTRRNSSVTALLGGIAQPHTAQITWVAPSAEDGDARAARLGLFDGLAESLGFRYEIVPIPAREYDSYYYEAGVNIIWTACHGIEHDVPVVVDADEPLNSLAGYQAVNDALASRVAAVAPDGAVVAIQDYQLMLVPTMVRNRRPDLQIIHFSHTPFPSKESLSRVPRTIVRTIVDGMLGADLLGFQRRRWARRFLDCCQWLGLTVDHSAGSVADGERRIWVRCYPVTVDSAVLTTHARSREVARWAHQIKADDPRKVIARVDRLDPAKNALRGFEAYAMLLRRHPELAREVRFVACLIPSRENVSSYRRYADRTRQAIHDINRQHPGSITVHYGDDRNRALGVLRIHDVLLVNPVADGMNLVAQEAAVVNDNDGVTVLSSTTGSADLLPGVINLTEPRSVEKTAHAIAEALSLSPAQRLERALSARSAIDGANPATWFNNQLADVQAIREGKTPPTRLILVHSNYRSDGS